MEKLCSKCDKTFDKGIEFCPFDGTKLSIKPIDNYCAECGQQYESEFQFCPVHGSPLNPFLPEVSPQESSEILELSPQEVVDSTSESNLVLLSEEYQDLFSRSMCPSCRAWKAWDTEGNKFTCQNCKTKFVYKENKVFGDRNGFMGQEDYELVKKSYGNIKYIKSDVLSGGQTTTIVFSVDEVEIRVERAANAVNLLVDGQVVDALGGDEKQKKVRFQGGNYKHMMVIENTQSDSLIIPNFDEGISVTVDGIPVQNTFADPYQHVQGGLVGIVGFLVFYVVGFIPVIMAGKTNIIIWTIIIYGPCVIAMAISVLLFKAKKKTALWIGVVFGLINIIDFGYGQLMNFSQYASKSTSLNPLAPLVIWGGFRVGLFVSIVKAIMNLRKI